MTRRMEAGEPLARLTLTGADLSLMDLSGQDLSGCILVRADLSHATLNGAKLDGHPPQSCLVLAHVVRRSLRCVLRRVGRRARCSTSSAPSTASG